MKFVCLLLAALSAIASAAHAQQLIKRTKKANDNLYYPVKEVFYVLKENDTLRHGPYQEFINNKPEFSGWYNQGKKDSVWQHFFKGSIVFSKRFYHNGERTGVWEFNDRSGNPIWKYDFNSRQAIYIDSSEEGFRDKIKVDGYQAADGSWIKGSPDKKPVRLATNTEWLTFLMANIRYPKEAIITHEQGQVWITIIINEKGEVTGFETEQNAMPALNEEALRICRLFPFEFLPAEKNGQAVAVKIKQPIIFRLEGPR